MTDYQVTYYIDHHKEITGKRYMWNFLAESYKNYIISRYNDSWSHQESIYRIKHNIDIRPTCLYCNKPIKFNIKIKQFNKFCSHRCQQLYQSPFKDSNTRNKIKETCIKKYGVENVLSNKYIRNKSKETCIRKYNDPNYNNPEKYKQTCLKKYGVESPQQVKYIKQKQINTSIQKYGSVFNKTKVSNTIKEKYGINWFTYTNKIKSCTNTKESLEKTIKTKRSNHTFNTSKIEDQAYDMLISKFEKDDVIRQYKSKVYPYCCDFYILSKDLYIEIQGSWTHGGHPYDNGSKEDNIILEKWKNKNTKYYNNAIQTWTIRDVTKRNTAKKNNLNYIEIWNIHDLVRYINNI